ncbi:MAG: CDP-glucose 4,6-dehydratase [Candidatus Promineifilaceae bacterium]|nr:CDP-glucose 4,6-dehydratase [Candidatus Promineifilaceae bacterium]
MMKLFNHVYEGLTVLVTGHTGFKGSWLTTWLLELGAQVIGYSLPEPPTVPSNFIVMDLGQRIEDIRGDVRDYPRLRQVILDHEPDLIFHLAAQPIVLHSISKPKQTLDINTGGTINVLEAVRTTNSVRALICVTTDKVYENKEWLWGYRETDRLGGHDPYSAGKAMAELAIASYRDSFFPPDSYTEHGVAVASVRVGNVIGGGDFADFRLVPDCMRALMAEEPIGIRNPVSVRPWQHVLEPLSGYLWLGCKLLQEGPAYAEAWNFGPLEQRGIPAQQLVEKLVELWGGGSWELTDPGYAKIETGQLRLSWEKAATRLAWEPVYSWIEALIEITTWFKGFQANQTAELDMYDVTRQHIAHYVRRAVEQGLPWAGEA